MALINFDGSCSDPNTVKVYKTDNQYDADLLIYIRKIGDGGTVPTDEEWFWEESWTGTPINWVDDEFFADLVVYETDDWMWGKRGWQKDHPLKGKLS